MAITASDRGTGTEGTSVNSFTPGGRTADMTAGSLGILCLAMDNASGSTATNLNATSYTDSAGNIWYVRATSTSGTANTLQEITILSAYLTSNFTTSATLTITLTANCTAKTWTWYEASSNLPGGTVYCNGPSATSSQATSVGSINQTSSFSASIGNLVIGIGASESPDQWTGSPIGDSDTTNGTWSTAQHTGVGTGAAGMSIITQYKITTTSYLAQTYDVTVSPNADLRVMIIQFSECDVKVKAFSGSASSSASLTVTLGYPMASGSIGVLCLAADNSGASGTTTNLPSTATDTNSNTWTRQQTGIRNRGVANQGVEFAIYTCVLPSGLAFGNTITITFISVNVPVKTALVYEIAPTGSGVMSYVTGGVGTGTTATSNSVTTSSITSGDYVVAMVAMEGTTGNEDGVTQDSDTTNGAWRAQASGTGGSAAGSITVAAQLKLVTATATQSYDVSFLGSNPNIQGWVQIDDSSTGIPTRQKAAFFQMF